MGLNGRHTDTPHKQKTREIAVSFPPALGSELRPTGDLGSAWDGCADTAGIPSALPASSTSHTPRRASSFRTSP
jgi:hypothetical protein